jgi:magnesium chelatase family protein
MTARKIQEERFADQKGIYANAQMTSKLIRKYVVLDEESNELIRNAMDRLGLSARAYDRILKVARTIADLENEENVQAHHLSEAIHYRSLDRESWGG